ncbi:mitochondrial translation release factor in rescue-like [Amphibalanus amphitrite]|uniref:mitochondrial translation release factor in rescue-like n=1 Tax=Amphibalanus amphitrite TaxID=1232801 RepID=UPI001C9196B4|nr:mitochondrial translation release factor in rescue-like [Amphibalanus amphitrite]XP_043214596.1 mitochondrial translation release factor in rescue-like [Amphibalanus amphitrite]XP_043214597.1 mitochondrial translation release factor in rescue-like [Amphibalanus amphitrite]XP_043214598.1 mitochondrial translation release factor in rescue-like [Amphibalanus amphitrite]XP_043214599.1 mitochondrial translation release factor in rescue-like [Amphibalanus amphitrite]XP_043214600.1 mitochondrial t
MLGGVLRTAAVLLRATPRCPAAAAARLAGTQGIDWSRFPQLDERELEERFVRGGGPGGQSVNKTANCVSLKHVPTGLVVKCHESRSLEVNRRQARHLLAERLDRALNGDASVAAQREREEQQRRQRGDLQRRRRRDRKDQWRRQRSAEASPEGAHSDRTGVDNT